MVGVHAAGARYKVTGQVYGIEGNIEHVAGRDVADLDSVLLPMVLCSDATVHDGKCVGDPDEGALVVLAAKPLLKLIPRTQGS